MAEVYSHQSPFAYAANNPIRFTDLLGMGPDDAVEDEDEEKKKKATIDPGHGDHHDSNKQVDPGAVKGEDKEKDLVLPIANAVNDKLEEAGIDAELTRTEDVEDAGARFTWRTKKAKDNDSDIIVSIHLNSNASESPDGFEVLYRTGDSNSKSLAESIVKENTVFKSRGAKPYANTGVVSSRRFSGPAVIVEAGFISNKSDLAKIKTQHKKIGTEIATGIINYFNK